ncbi:siderophore-interacting protein [Vibrio metschnikovii]|uniref:siderophore-interacting protein n=1 Tax=Vibrio metschnikovii TaxID=28172 RepID=UPI001C2F3E78|nr:siderophore-interacting protein [Vibrio metschnikovii]
MATQEKQRDFYRVTVTDTKRLSPNIQRITLQGDTIAHFGEQSVGGYFKLVFTPQGDPDLSRLTPTERPILRTYTIREFNPHSNQMTVDFVRHITDDPSCGFAARWAEQVQVGEQISIAGPGKSQGPNWAADWVYLAADMTALPALTTTLESLDPKTQGYAVIEISHPDDQQPLVAPPGVKIIWAHTDQGETLTQTVKAQPWLAGLCTVWCACEFEAMRELRQYFRNDKQVERDHIYISSYWKNGVTEDGHKVLKREDAEANS